MRLPLTLLTRLRYEVHTVFFAHPLGLAAHLHSGGEVALVGRGDLDVPGTGLTFATAQKWLFSAGPANEKVQTFEKNASPSCRRVKRLFAAFIFQTDPFRPSIL